MGEGSRKQNRRLPFTGGRLFVFGARGYNSGMGKNEGADETPVWNMDAGQWEALARRAKAGADALEDGAHVRVNTDTGGAELVFYATALNKPAGWAYPFLEAIPGVGRLGASVGRAWHEAATGFVQFEVSVVAAAQALAADYESGASDLDWVTYEQAVERAVRGTAAEQTWLWGEFGRLVRLAG